MFTIFITTAKIKTGNSIVHLHYMCNIPNSMSDLIEEGLNAYSIGDDVDGFVLKREVSSVEELRNAFEAGLNIDVTEKPGGDANHRDMVCASCKYGNEQGHEGCSRSPKSSAVISNDECLQKEQGKSLLDSGELKFCKPLIKCASFPCSVHSSIPSLHVSNEDSRKVESEILDGKQPSELKNSLYGRTLSLPSSIQLLSAMRGGQERSGLGPRPKLSVKWAPDVQEPQPSSASHTVKNSRQFHSKRKDKKHKHRGKSSHTSEGSKNSKKRHSKRIYNSESIHSRLQPSAYGNSILLDAWTSRNSMLSPVKSQLMGLGTPIFDMQTGQDDLLLNMHSKQFCEQGESDFLAKGLSEVDFLSQGLKCASSLRYTIQGKHLSCTEAA